MTVSLDNGYCARGAFCKFSHGDDAVVPSQLFPMNGGMPFMPMMGNGMGNVAGASNTPYDPRERIDMRPAHGGAPPMGNRSMYPRAPTMPREGDGRMGRKPGELPVIQDLTPHRPGEDRPHPPGDLGGQAAPPMQDMNVPTPMPINTQNGMNGMNGMMGVSQDVEMAGPSVPYQPPGGRGFRGGRGGGRGGHGFFGGDVQSFRPERRNDKTLVVEKIPEEKLSLGSVNEWFTRFGTVTNVAVDAVSAKALVTFSNHDEALAAWKSEDAVFGNRFVKVFWHRPMEGHGQAGQRALAASASFVANLAPKDGQPSAPPSTEAATVQPATTAAHARKPSAIPSSSAAAALAAKQKLLEQQIAEQKSLMAQLSTASAEEKKAIMARLRKLGEEMKPAASASQTPPPTTSTPAPAAKKARSTTPSVEDKQRLERERLDKELELHAAADGEGEESTEELKATLAKLKAEVSGVLWYAYGTELIVCFRPRVLACRTLQKALIAALPTGRTEAAEGVVRSVVAIAALCVVGHQGAA